MEEENQPKIASTTALNVEEKVKRQKDKKIMKEKDEEEIMGKGKYKKS